MRHCTQCGGGIAETASFCRHCGAAVGARRQPPDRPADVPAHPATAASVAPARPPLIGDLAGQAPPPSAFQNLSKAQAMRLIVKAGAKGLAKSLAMSAVVLGPGFVLLAQNQTLYGMVWLFLGAFGLMAWTYRKPWRLGWVSCLTPPVAAGAIYAIQLGLFGSNAPPAEWVAGAVLGGSLLGWLRGRAHQVYRDNSGIFAQRTHFYLAIWAAAFGLTQFIGLATRETLLIHGGLVTGAFTTAMLAMVSVALFARWKSIRAAGR